MSIYLFFTTVIHTQFGKDNPEILFEKKNCTYSLFMTSVDVCDRDIELQLKYYPIKH